MITTLLTIDFEVLQSKLKYREKKLDFQYCLDYVVKIFMCVSILACLKLSFFNELKIWGKPEIYLLTFILKTAFMYVAKYTK